MAEVEVDEVFGFWHFRVSHAAVDAVYSWSARRTVGDEAAEVSTNDAVPCRALALVELGES